MLAISSVALVLPGMDRQARFETLIEGLMEREYAVMDEFISGELVDALRQDLQARLAAGLMRPAGIGQQQAFQHNAQIRRDHISWIEDSETTPAEQEYIDLVKAFMRYLNETCYTGLHDFESHYAWYDAGSFYKKHIDQFRSDSGRKYSVIIYLNPEWTAADGGELVLYRDTGRVPVLPEGGRVVFFRSDRIEHEVLPARKPRLSITGWLKTK